MSKILRCMGGCLRFLNRGVYRLELSEGRYYIGSSLNIKRRILEHKDGGGSGWTRKYNVIRELSTITKSISPFWELEETLKNMSHK